MLIGKLGITFVKSGKLDPAEYEDLIEANGIKPCCGFNWWFWKPNIKTNFFRKLDTITIIKIQWLCFHFELEWWSFKKHTPKSQKFTIG